MFAAAGKSLEEEQGDQSYHLSLELARMRGRSDQIATQFVTLDNTAFPDGFSYWGAPQTRVDFYSSSAMYSTAPLAAETAQTTPLLSTTSPVVLVRCNWLEQAAEVGMQLREAGLWAATGSEIQSLFDTEVKFFSYHADLGGKH